MSCHLLQLTSGPDLGPNIDRIRTLLAPLAGRTGPHLVVLPECCLAFGSEGAWSEQAEAPGRGPMQLALSDLAKEFGLYLVAGTVPIKAEDGRAYAASLLFGPDGEQMGRYDKIHLFDVDVDDNTGRYRESQHTHPGDSIAVVETPFGRIGLAVCYDVRFPELFRRLSNAGAEIISLPSAFTVPTGDAHWEVLVRARAIENQCFILAAAQQGQHANGRRTWGHSMIVDPWGRLVAERAEGEALISANLDMGILKQTRARLPALTHRRLK